ncbi:hypothetical protein KCH_42340 [Kitasatospora cheerisanensis KCTC 2395]|uniref:Uncharacterized protein n=2 Tax=Kitasatospora cheerisanensis TaxID=81942 RepID=A0A066YSB1_9ACTN|nr:hypothetical protein KCH_42340 [Kitasatospora cheerisanensis KCTC 2395]
MVTRVSKLVAFSVAAIAAVAISATSVEYSGNVAGDVTWGQSPVDPDLAVKAAAGGANLIVGPNGDVTWGQSPANPAAAGLTVADGASAVVGPNGDVTWGG